MTTAPELREYLERCALVARAERALQAAGAADREQQRLLFPYQGELTAPWAILEQAHAHAERAVAANADAMAALESIKAQTDGHGGPLGAWVQAPIAGLLAAEGVEAVRAMLADAELHPGHRVAARFLQAPADAADEER